MLSHVCHHRLESHFDPKRFLPSRSLGISDNWVVIPTRLLSRVADGVLRPRFVPTATLPNFGALSATRKTDIFYASIITPIGRNQKWRTTRIALEVYQKKKEGKNTPKTRMM